MNSLFDQPTEHYARETSVQAYHAIRDNGLLGKLQLAVYEYLFNHGPLTAKEITVAFQANRHAQSAPWKRLSELVRAGLVREVGTVKCRYSDQEVIQWDVTDKIPDKKIKTSRRRKTTHGWFEDGAGI